MCSNPLRRIPTALAITAVLTVLSAPAFAVATARSEALDMDDKDRATVAKETMKQKKEMAANSKNGSTSSSSSCGNVDIGNSSDNKKASARIAEREKTVIVTGNVFNTASCGR